MRSVVTFAVRWLAAWCQVVVVAAMPLGPLALGIDPLGGVPICHAGADEGQPAPSQPAQTGHDCVLCAFCQVHSAPLVLLSPTLALPEPRQLASFEPNAPRARAPPSQPVFAAQPRGPPLLT